MQLPSSPAKWLACPLIFVGLLIASAYSTSTSSAQSAISASAAKITALSTGSLPASPGSFPTSWIHGADCVNDPKIQVHAYNADTYILRQSKCESYESPFMYLLFGDKYALLMDTGASDKTPVRAVVEGVVRDWLKSHQKTSIPLIVQHTHGHFDHIQGDGQFATSPYVVSVAPTTMPGFQKSWGFQNYPLDDQVIDLGGRVIDVIGTPGHHPSSVTLYDRNTRLLLTGDIVYPGHLFIFTQAEWPDFVDSIWRLVKFASTHPVEWVVGCHIEMSALPGRSFAYGTKVQPNEHVLEFKPKILTDILRAAVDMGPTPTCKKFDEFVIHPVYLCPITWN